MESAFLTIKEAAQFIGKAEVTIRRLLKRLLKNRTSETDRCIVEATEHGKRLYRIEARFLVSHANLNEGTRQRLLDQLDQTITQLSNEQAVRSQENSKMDQTPIQLKSTSEHLNSQTDRTPNQMNKKVDQMTKQIESEYASDQSDEQGTGQSDDQLRSQQSGIGSALLKEAMDELRNQLNVKDEEIKEKNKQLAKKDKTIDDLGASVDKLTTAIEQGNFLVASAQQRIPLPDDSKRETIGSQSEIVETKSDRTDSQAEPKSEEGSQAKPAKRGFIGRIADKISFSNN
jgi:hypothetical protein